MWWEECSLCFHPGPGTWMWWRGQKHSSCQRLHIQRRQTNSLQFLLARVTSHTISESGPQFLSQCQAEASTLHKCMWWSSYCLVLLNASPSPAPPSLVRESCQRRQSRGPELLQRRPARACPLPSLQKSATDTKVGHHVWHNAQLITLLWHNKRNNQTRVAVLSSDVGIFILKAELSADVSQRTCRLKD